MQHWLLLLFISVSTFIDAQTVKVSGKCLDKKGSPIIGAKVSSREAIYDKTTYSDTLGSFELLFDVNNTVTIYYSYDSFLDSLTIKTGDDAVLILKDYYFPIQNIEGVLIIKRKEDPFEIDPLKHFDPHKLPLDRFERSLIFMTAARSNNELTSNYNVRGGSYNENLVYVNGFMIYRPFLTRSGQQEGLSFIHSSLVSSVQFSGGGFDARYGDKLSSVLDITYKTPDTLNGSVMLSMLGEEGHFEQTVNNRFNYMVGARYRANGYFLNSLPAKGAYNPVFYDGQFLTNYALSENLIWSVIGHYSSNDYRFTPQTQETDFGTANEAYSFKIYFEGQEQTRFRTMTGATSLKWEPTKKTKLDLYVSLFNTNEKEYFDVLGQYFINKLETDPSKEEYGDSIAVLGIGSFLNHARNKLNANILNIYHDGQQTLKNDFTDTSRTKHRDHKLLWGGGFQMNEFHDVLSEWKMVDSAGYSIPQEPADEIILFESIKSKLSLYSQWYNAYIQTNSVWSSYKKNYIVSFDKKERDAKGAKTIKTYTDTIENSSSKWALSFGTRAGYTSNNNEFYVTPRGTIKFFPRKYILLQDEISKSETNYHFSTGLYYQPPFYRELRTFSGELKTDVKSQKSFHLVLGSDQYFPLWNRKEPFKLTIEGFYKYMWDVIPFEVDNVRIRYFAENNAVAYAYGLDLNLHGEFVEGIESYFKLGLLSTKEDLLDDYYYDYYNAAGEKIIFGYSEDQVVTDSVRIEPGYIPRPTDQWINFATLIQDRMPKYESFSVQMAMNYGTRLPYGPPDLNRYKDTLRMKAYFRVDLGLSYDFLYKKSKESKWKNKISGAIVSFEVLNLLGINNVLSKQWIQDVEGKYYSIPNYLTQRRFNLKFLIEF